VGIVFIIDATSRNVALACVNAKQHTKFLFPRLITFGNIEGYQHKNVELLISPDTEDKFLYGTLVLVNAYKCTKFQLPSCISFKDTVGAPK